MTADSTADATPQPTEDELKSSRKTLSDWGQRIEKISEFRFRVALRRETGEYVGLCEQIPRLAFADYDPRRALEGIRKLAADVARRCDSSAARPSPAG